ncbi:dimethylamine monooxygenase subunit DmmA family protein [Bacillus cihuensis]|uniref:dimethylamine monooxygenase subunit DmmA family protein n=1 Tax=Bacillus cihuensis TaxID=1208599 RepID=UPI0003FFF541|nr:dimethylamine monooxygenase subunit DmmA family protein [Bacillus cihuensis]
MNTVKGRVIQVENSFDQGFIAEVKLLSGSNSQTIGFAKQIICNQTQYKLPVYLVETGKQEGTYRLVMNTTTYPKQEKMRLVEELKDQEFELVVEEDPYFELHHSCEKMLLLIDQSALFVNLAEIDFLSLKNIEFHVFVLAEEKDPILDYLQQKHGHRVTMLSSFVAEDVQDVLDKQLIGTKLFISGDWSMVRDVKQVAYSVGFTDAEIQTKEIGIKEEKVYCVKCYNHNLKTNSDEITCVHCHTVLDVSNHFSKRLDAYLGYIHVV